MSEGTKRKIFISYKYRDNSVYPITESSKGTTVRDYVDYLSCILENEDHVLKCEPDDLDLSDSSDEVITKHLSDRMFDSTITIVLISPNMMEPGKTERNQWIPWEISYSLRNRTRTLANGEKNTKKGNGMIGVVLPDSLGYYDYVIKSHNCCNTGCNLIDVQALFKIIGANMFNLKNGKPYVCNEGSEIWDGEHSYIPLVRWKDFLEHIDAHIKIAWERRKNIDDYTLYKQLD